VEYANSLRQDSPELIKYVTNNFLIPPVPRDAEYNLRHDNVTDPSMGQSKRIREILQNKVRIMNLLRKSK
jgi:hypothetical protein